MAAKIGRKVAIKKGGVLIAGARTKTININNEPVDITTDDDDGFRTLLEDSATRSVDLSIEGVTKNQLLVDAAATGDSLIGAYTIEFPESGGLITGDFRFNALSLGASHDDAVTFSAELQSTGEFTYTVVSG
jgi:TP901-1 family phage major tail protein